MNRCKQALALMVGALLATTSTHAAFVLNGTRFIYQGDQQSIVATVRNEAKVTYGGQVWIASAQKNQVQTALIPTPTFFKLSPGQSQVVRILGVQTEQLPATQETLMLLNVQEIPPAPKGGGNAISIAMNTQVKLIYRPQALQAGRRNAEDQLQFVRGAKGLVVTNPTPYFFAIASMRVNQQRQVLTPASDKALATLAPFSSITLQDRIGAGALTVDLLDDHGATRTITVGADQ